MCIHGRVWQSVYLLLSAKRNSRSDDIYNTLLLLNPSDRTQKPTREFNWYVLSVAANASLRPIISDTLLEKGLGGTIPNV